MSEEIDRESTGKDQKAIGKFVRDLRFGWQPVELTENWCDVGRRRCTDYETSSTVLDSVIVKYKQEIPPKELRMKFCLRQSDGGENPCL